MDATINDRSVYCSAMSVCFDMEFDKICKGAFWNEGSRDFTTELIKI